MRAAAKTAFEAANSLKGTKVGSVEEDGLAMGVGVVGGRADRPV